MSRLVIISNRLPITIDNQEGELIYHPSAGGLATGLSSLSEDTDKIWIGWPGQEIKDAWLQESVRQHLTKRDLIPVFLSEAEIELYYRGFSNKTIWPHFHYFTQYTTYDDSYWEAYRKVNQKFAEVVMPLIQPDDLVWVHDYQLLLLPQMIRQSHPQVSIGFFLHIPFPSYEVFRILPWREELLEGVLGADLIGFHTFGYMRHFLSAAYRIGGYEHNFGRLTKDNRLIQADVFPMGIDYEKYAFPQHDPEQVENANKIKQLAEGRRLIISIDRLDYSKGIPNRILAFKQFIDEHPEYHKKVSIVLIVVPSRSSVDQYQELKHRVDTLVGQINGEYGTFDWMPIRYFYRSLNFTELTTLYKQAEIAMITPLRDGMNLVAKEFVASKEDSKQGVLILSEMAGAADELTEALMVNPQDVHGISQALKRALEMDVAEQARRLRSLQEKLKRYNVSHWANTFTKEQKKLMEKQQGQQISLLVPEQRQEILEAYQQARRRLIILDYDGTLMGFKSDPQDVEPDEELLSILQGLNGKDNNHLIVNSGRDRSTLEEWLAHLGIDMAAEHGVWVRRGGEWSMNGGLSDGWKEEVRSVLNNLVERTPGSFIEEKDYSLAWHYRNIDRDFGEKRVREFRDVLLYLTANLDLQVLEGNKVVEIKNAGVNKGKATQIWLTDEDWDFILAIGDDHTDEDTFKALPADAFTIKVGVDQTSARYRLLSAREVRSLLREMAAL